MKKYIRNIVPLFLLGWFALASPEWAQAQRPSNPARMTGARDIVKEIIGVVGLTPRFEMREANIENAAAVIVNGKRYILYNTRFLNEVNNASRTDWAAVSILAHEIGHHLNGHTLIPGGSNPSDELEADEFSGFVLRKMGASLAQAQAAMAVLSEERESATHPGRNSRLTAIGTGWRQANNQLLAVNTKVSDKPVQVQNLPATRPVAAVAQPVLDNRFILSKVNFKNAPQEEFYITTRGNLVRVKNNQLEVIGKIAETHHPDFPFVFRSSKIAPLFVSKAGIIYNQQGRELGWLS
jgi:hypothetical protein